MKYYSHQIVRLKIYIKKLKHGLKNQKKLYLYPQSIFIKTL